MSGGPVAVLGIGCRWPGGANDPDAFWELLASAKDAVTPIPPERWDHTLWHDPDPTVPGRTTQKAAALLTGIDQFDAAHFGIAPREAEAMDPQQRLLLETTWHALEDAGVAPDHYDGRRVGVFLGLYNNNYGLIGRGSPDPAVIGGWSASGTHPSIAAGRLAFTFGFTGPALVVDTACSSSLVAVHLAVQSLRLGECELAIAGGVNLVLSPLTLVASAKLGATAPDGRCKPFDARADGFGQGEGCGVVVLRRLADVAGQRVRAVIRGSAVNQDGRSAGLTAPSGPAQAAVVRAALADAGVEPEAVDAIEAHGTGTALGDPIELGALAQVFHGRDRPLWVGSVKGNLGHAEAVAGIAGLLKAVLMLERGAVVPSLHFARLNPAAELMGCPIEVPVRPGPAPKVVGVSSFGFSGTNAHVVLEAAPAVEAVAAAARPVVVLPLAARTEAAFGALVAAYRARLADGADWPGLARAGARRQARLAWRGAVVAGSTAEAATALAALRPVPAGRSRIGFLITGQGAGYPGMAQGLLAQAPVVAETFRRCEAVMRLERPLAELMEDGAALSRTGTAQPVLFALAVGLGLQLRAWGIAPVALLGHSLGEYAAAVLAEAAPLEDVARLVARRAALMQALPAGGGMAALLGPREAALAALRRHGELEVAAWNAPEALAVAGPVAALERLAADPAAAGLTVQPLTVSHAFHSAGLEPMLDGLEAAAGEVAWAPPKLPVIGNRTGLAVKQFDATHWRLQARAPVRFEDGLRSLAGLGCEVLVELGAQPVLSGLARATLGATPTALPTLARGRDPLTTLATTLAELFRQGAQPDWQAFDPAPTTTNAPLYPFQRQRYWLDDPTLRAAPAPPASNGHDAAAGDERVWGFYDELARVAHPGHEIVEEHLTFGLMDRPAAGFSWVRALLEGPKAGQDYEILGTAQRRLKEAALEPVDLTAVRRVLDFGCGHGADLITLARRFPHLELHGFTLSGEQAGRARRSAADAGLGERCRFHHADSARQPFPGRFDLVFGFEVAGLIADKPGLFANIAGHLTPGGTVVIADFVATSDEIAAVDTASFTPTAAVWADLFARHRMRVTRCEDTSDAVANFLDDLDFSGNVDRLVARHGLSELTRRHLLSNHNIMRALRRGLVRYVLLMASHEPAARVEALQAANEAILGGAGQAADSGPERSWFYGTEWRRHPTDLAVRQAATDLDAHATAAAALDSLAHRHLRAADLPSLVPAPRHRRLYQHLLRIVPGADAPLPTAEPLPELALLERCGPHLRAVLEGGCDPLDLLFPGGEQDAAEALYARSPFTRAANAIAAAAMSDLLAGRGSVRILEVGAGTGGTTGALMGVLRTGDGYVFSDVSVSFVNAGRRRFGCEARVLDIDRAPEEQGLAPSSFDVVVAANVLHVAIDLRASLARLHGLLRPGGALLLVENCGPMLWGDLTFGLTEGMWRFADDDLRHDHALLDETRWLQVLSEAGFDAKSLPAGTAATAAASRLVVFMARRREARRIRQAGAGSMADATDIVDARPCLVERVEEAPALVHQALEVARAAAAMAEPPRLWLVTRRARAVLPGEATSPMQATIHGLASTLALEHPELRVSVIDTDDPASAEAIVATGTLETRIAVRNGVRHALRLTRLAAPAVAPMQGDGTCLIVGGFGEIGRAVAGELVAGGARSLALAGPRSRQVVVPGAIVRTFACDVSREEEVAALLRELASCSPPLKAIFHLAGLLDDAVLAGQTPLRIATVLAPKVLGAAWLDRHSRALPIEQFVLFSSSAALIGSAAQANHAAANAFLDALAERRRAEGLPALSIAWGAWGEIGAAARAGAGVARRGLRPMPPAAATRALRRALALDRATAGVMDVDWPTFCGRFAGAAPPWLDEIRPRAGRLDQTAPALLAQDQPSLVDGLASLPVERRFDRLVEAVRAAAARTLGVAGSDDVPADAPLRELGLDSLMTVELRNALAVMVAAKLPATLIFDHPTCTDLARFLAAGPLVGQVMAPAADGEEALDGLDIAELSALLERELDQARPYVDGARP